MMHCSMQKKKESLYRVMESVPGHYDGSVEYSITKITLDGKQISGKDSGVYTNARTLYKGIEKIVGLKLDSYKVVSAYVHSPIEGWFNLESKTPKGTVVVSVTVELIDDINPIDVALSKLDLTYSGSY